MNINLEVVELELFLEASTVRLGDLHNKLRTSNLKRELLFRRTVEKKERDGDMEERDIDEPQNFNGYPRRDIIN